MSTSMRDVARIYDLERRVEEIGEKLLELADLLTEPDRKPKGRPAAKLNGGGEPPSTAA